jgi:hypothetical protein
MHLTAVQQRITATSPSRHNACSRNNSQPARHVRCALNLRGRHGSPFAVAIGESPRATSRIGRELPEHHGALSSTLTRVVARPTVSQDVLTVKGERGGRLVRPNYQMTGSKYRIIILANSVSIDLNTSVCQSLLSEQRTLAFGKRPKRLVAWLGG